jgi:hypothetical protein
MMMSVSYNIPHNNEAIVLAKPDTGYPHDINVTSVKYAIIIGQLGIAIPTNRGKFKVCVLYPAWRLAF